MSEYQLEQRKSIGKWINRLHYKSTWQMYIDGRLPYSQFKSQVFYTMNAIRKAIGYHWLTDKQLEEAWQYRTFAHEDYKVAFDHLVNGVLGWW